MSLFGELDVESAEDNPFSIPDGTYTAFVTDIKVGETAGNNGKAKKLGLTLIYTVSEGEYDGRKAQEWKQIPQPADPKNPTDEEKTALSYLKMRMQSLGVPDDKINSVTYDDLVGREVVITLVTKGEYQNVRKVTEKQDTGALADKFA